MPVTRTEEHRVVEGIVLHRRVGRDVVVAVASVERLRDGSFGQWACYVSSLPDTDDDDTLDWEDARAWGSKVTPGIARALFPWFGKLEYRR